MKEKWDKKPAEPRVSDGHPVPEKWLATEPMYKPKLYHSSSMREAMRHYRDVPIDGNSGEEGGNENRGFEPDLAYDYYIEPDYSISNESDSKNRDFPSSYDHYSINTLGKSSTRTATSGTSDQRSVSGGQNEMGSSVKLVTTKVGMSCQSWCSHISTIFCTLSMAAGIGNIYRLPQTTIIRGGLPFLVVYTILTVIIGLPMLFLELGIGQMAQQGFIKSWRVVPFFKGIGYVKLLAGCLLSIYYPLYMAMAVMYVIWILKDSMPFSECSSGVIITAEGYYVNGESGQDCLRTTFIQSPFTDPYYFGIYAAILLFLWIIIALMSIRRTKSYIKSLLVIFVPTMICYIALTTKSILLEAEINVLYKFFENVDWSVLKNAEIWYFATIQVFFSTSVGFGSFITNAGILYSKVNPLWTALGYTLVNLIFGTGSIIITTILTENINKTGPVTGDVAELELYSLMYDSMKGNTDGNFRFWMVAFFGLIFFSGLISMATLLYTLLKAIHGHDDFRIRWWKTDIILSVCGFVLGIFVLMLSDFNFVHLLDHYIVGNLILICVILEVLALIAFYGTARIQSDFEFMLGHILSKVWLVLWWIIPIILIAIFTWALCSLPLEGIYKHDPAWLYGMGWAVVFTAFIFIFVIGGWVMSKQDGYTFKDKLKASLNPSHNWGPTDPMLRHNWVQWNTQSNSGERDFTLKRRGTKEYTRTIKKNAKKKALSDLTNSPIPGAYHQTDTIGKHSANINNNRISNGSREYQELYYINMEPKKHPEYSNGNLTETSLVDSLEHRNGYHHHHHHKKHHHHHHHHHKNERHSYPETDFIQSNGKQIDIPDESSEGYGTYRNGPFFIDKGNMDHVCHRRESDP